MPRVCPDEVTIIHPQCIDMIWSLVGPVKHFFAHEAPVVIARDRISRADVAQWALGPVGHQDCGIPDHTVYDGYSPTRH